MFIWAEELHRIPSREAAEIVATVRSMSPMRQLAKRVTGPGSAEERRRSMALRIESEPGGGLAALISILDRSVGLGASTTSRRGQRKLVCHSLRQLGELSAPRSDAEAEILLRRLCEERLLAACQKLLVENPDGVESAIDAQLQRLPAAERDALAKVLGVDTLTGKSLRAAAASGTLATAFAAGVNAAGFGAYVALTTAMHAVFTTALGVTLPFGVYTGATSALSLASGGALLVPLGAFLALNARRSNTKLIRAMTPMILLSLSTRRPPPEPSDGWHPDPWKEADLRWHEGGQWTFHRHTYRRPDWEFHESSDRQRPVHNPVRSVWREWADRLALLLEDWSPKATAFVENLPPRWWLFVLAGYMLKVLQDLP